MILRDIINLVRVQLDDTIGEAKRLWSDADLTSYANVIQDKLAEECHLITDSVTASDADNVPVCVIPVETGNAIYPVHGKILQIMRVRYDGQTNPLLRVPSAILDATFPEWQTRTGLPSAYVLDMNAKTLTLDRVPETFSNLRLTVKRLPLTPLVATNLKASPEIPDAYHVKMLNGMLYMAYSKQDADTFDGKRAADYMTRFQLDLEDIRRDELRRHPKHIGGPRRSW